LRQRWEQRAFEKGGSCGSVLFQGLSDSVNEYIHERHKEIVCDRFLHWIPHGAAVLDLGCGYGRLGKEIRASRPDLQLTGLDFALNYCRLYSQVMGSSVVCADAARPPFAPRSFDAIVAVTALMYVPAALRAEVMSYLIELLRPGGVSLFLDPGKEFSDMVAKLRPASRRNTTGGDGFTEAEYLDLSRFGAARLVESGGMPFLSAALPVLFLIGDGIRRLRPLLRLIDAADRRWSRHSRYSVHRWIILRRE